MIESTIPVVPLGNLAVSNAIWPLRTCYHQSEKATIRSSILKLACNIIPNTFDSSHNNWSKVKSWVFAIKVIDKVENSEVKDSNHILKNKYFKSSTRTVKKVRPIIYTWKVRTYWVYVSSTRFRSTSYLTHWFFLKEITLIPQDLKFQLVMSLKYVWKYILGKFCKPGF